ncbi:MAG: ABC transporter ATP-binding protein, partial [Spirochaetales bacterium]|nr:ABC transporter ATP-binding protein [Spirochaetales bacterium]
REEEILTRIAELEAAHKKIGEDMARPGVYADGAKMKALTEELTRNEEAQKLLHTEWEKVAGEIAKAGELPEL